MSAAITNKNENDVASWTAVSTMGIADTDGTNNLYVEDNYFLAFWQGAAGLDGHARAVWRHNVFDSSALTSHGADTEELGVRHWEVYDNTFVQSDRGGEPYNLNYWFYVRGGTGVITDNTVDDLNTSTWGDKIEFYFTIQVLQRNVGPPFGCWGANVPGVQYPAPRQIGFGYVTGRGGNDALGIYQGDSEPIYVWNNTGTYTVGVGDYGGTDCTNPDSTAAYFVPGRDYYWNAGAKPGYAKYSYPHPLRRGPAAPTNLRIR